MTTTHINMATDFSAFPYGRTYAQGRYNAEAFRVENIVPALKTGAQVIVNLTGISGMSASYVQEAFGNLVDDFDLKDLRARLKILAADDGSLIKQAWNAMEETAANRKRLAH